jgi:polar amino acid transport system substrate-binding protein
MKGGHPDQDHMLFTQNYAFYRLKTSHVAWDGRKLTGFSGVVGVPPGYSVCKELKKLGLSYESSPPRSILKKMASGRLQLAALLEQEGDRLLMEDPELNGVIEKMSPPLVTKPYYLMLSHQFVRDNPKLADRIWQLVREVRLKEYPRLQNEYVHQHH